MNHSDLTIADFWGINKLVPEYDDDKWVGLVLVNTEKGSEYFSKLPMNVMEMAYEQARRYNGGFNENTKPHPKRSLFFSLIDESKSVEAAVGKCLHVPVLRRVVRKAKRPVKKCIKGRNR